MAVHGNNKEPIIKANKVLKVIILIHLLLLFFFISLTSLIHHDRSHFTLNLTLAAEDDISAASSMSNTKPCLSACFAFTCSSRSKAVGFNQTGGAMEKMSYMPEYLTADPQ